MRGLTMPSKKQINAATKILKGYGYTKADAFDVARHMLLAAESVSPLSTPKQSRELVVVDLFDDWPKDYRERFWQAFPQRVGKGTALVVLDKVKASHEVSFDCLMSGLSRYVDHVNNSPTLNWCHPSTWLNQKRWLDEFATPRDNNGHGRNGFAAIARGDL
jgi:hypothetical protein